MKFGGSPMRSSSGGGCSTQLGAALARLRRQHRGPRPAARGAAREAEREERAPRARGPSGPAWNEAIAIEQLPVALRDRHAPRGDRATVAHRARPLGRAAASGCRPRRSTRAGSSAPCRSRSGSRRAGPGRRPVPRRRGLRSGPLAGRAEAIAAERLEIERSQQSRRARRGSPARGAGPVRPATGRRSRGWTLSESFGRPGAVPPLGERSGGGSQAC